MIRSLIKDSKKLKKSLKARWKELGLTQLQVSDDALRLTGDKGFSYRAISRFMNNAYERGALNDEQVIFLAKRYSIDIKLSVKFNKEHVQKHDEELAIKQLKKKYPHINLENYVKLEKPKRKYPYVSGDSPRRDSEPE